MSVFSDASTKKKIICAIPLIVLSVTYTCFMHGYRLQPRSVREHECPERNSNFVTVVPGGRLGNGIFEYLSTWTFAQEVGGVPVVPVEIIQQLLIAFQNIEMPTLEDMASVCDFNVLSKVKKRVDTNFTNNCKWNKKTTGHEKKGSVRREQNSFLHRPASSNCVEKVRL